MERSIFHKELLKVWSTPDPRKLSPITAHYVRPGLRVVLPERQVLGMNGGTCSLGITRLCGEWKFNGYTQGVVDP